MSYVEEINSKLLWLQRVVDEFQKYYSIDMKGLNEAYDLARQDADYNRLKNYYLDLKNEVGTFINALKSYVLSLPDRYFIKEFEETIDICNAIDRIGFSEYSTELVSKCHDEMARITAQSSLEQDIKAIEKLFEYHAEIRAVYDRFDELYYKYVRTRQVEQLASDEYHADLDKLKNDLDKKLNGAKNEALSAIGKYKATYQQITDVFSEERFAAQIGKPHTSFPTKICLGSILHPVEDCGRDVLVEALSCGNVDSLPVPFEMPLVGGFDDYETKSVAKPETAFQQKKSLIDNFDDEDWLGK